MQLPWLVRILIFIASLFGIQLQTEPPIPSPVVVPTLAPVAPVSPPSNPPVSTGPCPGDEIIDPCSFSSAVVAGAIAGQAAPMFCRVLRDCTSGTAPASCGVCSDTSVSTGNGWLDDFNHGLSYATLAEGETNYRVFDSLGSSQSVHWRHLNHWMVDLADAGAAMLTPARSFSFGDRLIVEADAAAGISSYSESSSFFEAWPEIIVTTSSAPTKTGRPRGVIYGYEYFPFHYTLGCRMENEGNTICSLMDNTDVDDIDGGRIWEMSFFQQVGTTTFGGARFNERADAFRLCTNQDADINCRDRFRLELTATSLTIYVNAVKYFEQTGIPTLPFVNQPIYVYFASVHSGLTESDAVRYHWDRLAVNPSGGPTAAESF